METSFYLWSLHVKKDIDKRACAKEKNQGDVSLFLAKERGVKGGGERLWPPRSPLKPRRRSELNTWSQERRQEAK